MERYFTFLGRKNQYCENDYTTKCNLQIQFGLYQITNDIVHRTRTKNFTVQMETQKTLNSQSNLEKEEWSWRSQPWTAAYQAPPSMGFSRQEYWSGVPSPSPISNLGIMKMLCLI